MSEDVGTMPSILLATAEFRDEKVILHMEDRDRGKVDFALEPMAAAILSLTLQPALRLAVDNERRTNPDVAGGGFPDTPEGL